MKYSDQTYHIHLDSNSFICPICLNLHKINESEIVRVETERVPVRTSTFGTATTTEYECHYHNFRVCKQCMKREVRIVKSIMSIYFVLFILFLIAFGYFYYNIEEFWISDFFISTNLDLRSTMSFVLWCIAFAFLALVGLGFVLMISKNFYHSVDDISFDEALKCGAIAR